MVKLKRDDLWSLEQYSELRPSFRQKVMSHKKTRQLALGDNVRFYFEDETTIRYQIQEMLRIEKIFDAEGIQEELDSYNPLIPDGHNWKATLMLQFEDPEIRAIKTRELRGIEKTIWVKVKGFEKVYPFANEDLERDNGEKTSTVHFLRFEFTPPMIEAMQHGAEITAGIEHEGYRVEGNLIDGELRNALVSDLEYKVVH